MNAKEAFGGIRRFAHAFDAALDYDPFTESRLWVERLERLVGRPRCEDAGMSNPLHPQHGAHRHG
jgi:hypothetical protein